jgi:phosphoribosylformylglycinamidine (FGAM) synthase PurS component
VVSDLEASRSRKLNLRIEEEEEEEEEVFKSLGSLLRNSNLEAMAVENTARFL